MTNSPIDELLHVAVIHEHPILRCGLAGAMADQRAMLVSAELPSADAYAARVPAGRHCVVFASLAQGLALLRRVRADGWPAPVPAVTIVDAELGELDARDALRLGARGLLRLDAAAEELFDCARTLAGGGHYLARPLAALLARQVHTPPLTSREEEVLQQIYGGSCNKLIARELGIAVGTVKTHVKAILSKLEASNRTEAVAVAQRRGLVRSARGAETEDTRASKVVARTPALVMPLHMLVAPANEALQYV